MEGAHAADPTPQTAASDQPINDKPHIPKPKKKKKIIFNIANTEYEVIKRVGELSNYQLSSSSEDDEWDLYWHDLGISTERLTRMKPYQKINHFPGMQGLARKNQLGRNLYKMSRIFPNDYNFFPETWLLPYDWGDLKSSLSKKKTEYFIVKPEGLSQGQGIFLTTNFEEVAPTDHYVVQRYLTTPYLINGLKFDLRIYVLIYGCDPMRLFIFKEGIARFCTEPYSPPEQTNITNMNMHLTNYAVNKLSDKFINNRDSTKTDVGHKRSLESIWKHIDCNGGKSKDLISKIKRSIVKTLIAVQPSLSHIYHYCQPNDIANDMCFELLGFDVILDSDLIPYILEVNQAPSFNTDSPLDDSVKTKLLTETFKILKMETKGRVKYKKMQKEIMRNKAMSAHTNRMTKEERQMAVAQRMEERDKYEGSVIDNYELIYPNQVYANYRVSRTRSSWMEQKWCLKGYHLPKRNCLKPQQMKSQRRARLRILHLGLEAACSL
jgi:tubulin polyglutamylase TTLL6/13